MAQKPGKRFPGNSKVGFSEAAANAVAKAEKARTLRPKKKEPITLVVSEMKVLVEGPIGEYRVVLVPQP